MSPRFVLASVSLPGGGPNEHLPGLNFGWQPSKAPPQLLAFINAPISVSYVDSPVRGPTFESAATAAANGPADGLSNRGPPEPSRPPALSHLPLHQHHSQFPSRDADESEVAERRPRFPPWKHLAGGLTPVLGGRPQHQLPVNRHVLAEAGQADEAGSIAVESCGNGRRRRVYLVRGGTDAVATADNPQSTALAMDAATTGGETPPYDGFDIVDERQTHEDHLRALVAAYLLPNGFPDSVGPQYAPYMAWRGVQYFFGGAISVFTTQSLLGALGVAGRYSGEAAAAINWVIKDGAGRLGRLLFARWGRELDCELKQFRLAGDLLMEAGAALELATIYSPPAFLPLACTANLAKNLAAVAASSTRAPIYRTFALQNNLADITAKGESVANLADILGTVAGILLSRMKLPRMTTFCALSAGYLIASRKEVDSVELPYMNRARLAYAARRYLTHGSVPGVAEANRQEPLLPWGRYNQGRLVLGASVEVACAGPGELAYAAQRFPQERYRFLVTYRPDTQKAYVLLREGATPLDCLQASFFGHVFLHLLDGGHLAPPMQQSQTPVHTPNHVQTPVHTPTPGCGGGSGGSCSSGCRGALPSSLGAGAERSQGGGGGARSEPWGPGGRQQGHHHQQPAALPAAAAAAGWRGALEAAQEAVAALYPDFLAQAESSGWRLQQTMLNPRENRLLRLTAAPLTAA